LEAPIITLAFHLFLSRLSNSIHHSLPNCCPWSKLVDRFAFSCSDSLTDATSCLRKNLTYFYINYMTIIVVVLVISITSHRPLLATNITANFVDVLKCLFQCRSHI
ncbi:unnamed protein product, partial [Musa acuminata subsp. malaccensis]